MHAFFAPRAQPLGVRRRRFRRPTDSQEERTQHGADRAHGLRDLVVLADLGF